MNNMENLKSKLKLPPVSHLGIVVENMERAIEYYSSIFGISPFNVREFSPDKHWFMEEPSPLKLLNAKAMLGNLEIELIRPLEGRSLHQEFLDAHGEGLQHLGFSVDNYEEMFDSFLKAGFKPLMRAESYVTFQKGYLKACYFDTRRVGGIVFEIGWRSWEHEKPKNEDCKSSLNVSKKRHYRIEPSPLEENRLN